MAESKADQIADAIVAALGAIVGDGGETYWYDTSRAGRAVAPSREYLDDSLGTEPAIYLVVPGDPEECRPAAFGGVRFGELPIDLVAAHRFLGDPEQPLAVPAIQPSRWTVQDRMLRDAERALLADATLGGLAIDLAVERKDVSPENTYIDGWAVAYLRCRVLYQYTDSTP